MGDVVLVDSNVLTVLLNPDAPLVDPDTKLPVENAHQSVMELLRWLEEEGGQVLIPAPVLAEVLASEFAEGRDHELVAGLNGHKAIAVAGFDSRAAIHAAELFRQWKNRRKGLSDSQPRQKVKVDVQIVAIGIANSVTSVCSYDAGLRRLAADAGLNVEPLREGYPLQGKLPFK